MNNKYKKQPPFARRKNPQPQTTPPSASYRFPKEAQSLTDKKKALAQFWDQHDLPGAVPEIIPSPRETHYRTTSKRKAVFRNGKLDFFMGYSLNTEFAAEGKNGALLEAELHGELYALILEILRKPHYQPLAKALNFCILRGSYDRAAVILNVFRLSGEIMRKMKLFAAELEKQERVTGIFLYCDETRSEYYFESFRPRTGAVEFKKISGRSLLDLSLPDRPKLLYPPTVFSQVNESILPAFTDRILGMLALNGKKNLIDLYCGYGLFSLYAAPDALAVTGLDFEGPSIKAARANAAHLYPEQSVRYEAQAVTPESVQAIRFPVRAPEVILLDPPRSGTSDGVIAAVAARKPERVAAVYCGIDNVPHELRLWQANGFRLEESLCFDMFPGSPNLETVLLLKPLKTRS